jgi:hypothetical protein
MSRWSDHAEAMAKRLRETIMEMQGSDAIPVIVERQLDVATSVQQEAAKASGGLVMLVWTESRNLDTQQKVLRMSGEFSALCMTKPMYTDDKITCDDLAEKVAVALHDWLPADKPYNEPLRTRVTGISLVPETKGLLTYEVRMTAERLI